MTDAAFIPKPIGRLLFRKTEISFLIAWFDIWVGLYIDPKTHALYICPFPCCVFYIGERKQNGE